MNSQLVQKSWSQLVPYETLPNQQKQPLPAPAGPVRPLAQLFRFSGPLDAN